MPETVFQVISEMEVRNEQAKQNLKEQSALTEDLSKAELEQLDIQRLVEQTVNRSKERQKKKVQEVKDAKEEETKATNASARAQSLSNRVLSQFRQLLNRIIPSQNKYVNGLKRMVTSSIALNAATGLVIATSALVVDALSRVESVTVAVQNITDRLVSEYEVFSSTLGQLLTGNFSEFLDRLAANNALVDTAILLRQRLRDQDKLAAIEQQRNSNSIALLNQEIETLNELREQALEVGSDNTLGAALVFLDQETEARKEILRLELESIAAQRAILNTQRDLDLIRGRDTEEKRLERELELQKLIAKEIEINAKFNNFINDSLEEREEIISRGRDVVQLTNLFSNRFETLDLNQILGDPDAISERNRDFLEKLLSELESDLGELEPAFTQVFLRQLAAGSNIEDALEAKEGSILETSKDIFTRFRSDLQAEIVAISGTIDLLEAQVGGRLPETFTESDKVLAAQLEEARRQLAEFKKALTDVNNEIANVDTQIAINASDRSERARDELLESLRTSFSAINQILSTLSSGVRNSLNEQNDLIEDQIDLIDQLKNDTLSANSDIVASEQEKLSRLLADRRNFTNQLRTLATLEFVASAGSAIANAAGSGPAAIPQILGVTAALLASLAKLKSAAIFHEGIRSVGGQSGPGLRSDEVFAILQKRERVMSKEHNKPIEHLSNHELMRAGVEYSERMKERPQQVVIDLDKQTHVLEEIKERIGSLAFNVSLDRRGFFAGLQQAFDTKTKVQSLRR